MYHTPKVSLFVRELSFKRSEMAEREREKLMKREICLGQERPFPSPAQKKRASERASEGGKEPCQFVVVAQRIRARTRIHTCESQGSYE